MSLADELRDNAREWDISECPQRAEIARAAADRIEELEAELASPIGQACDCDTCIEDALAKDGTP